MRRRPMSLALQLAQQKLRGRTFLIGEQLTRSSARDLVPLCATIGRLVPPRAPFLAPSD